MRPLPSFGFTSKCPLKSSCQVVCHLVPHQGEARDLKPIPAHLPTVPLAWVVMLTFFFSSTFSDSLSLVSDLMEFKPYNSSCKL